MLQCSCVQCFGVVYGVRLRAVFAKFDPCPNQFAALPWLQLERSCEACVK
ncbi:hypothetical protein RBSWK_02638 [Rhodopirellula baltica SWK14]|uniref:Uncharacterized protein n=1 Tax=Rhodopirellula baltica SWK14 TaxID=993516 RepID=L7CHH1_RHOBT|nr:hypothetical protein RBSWK_02638 [Rhodopirellula baltica SWK14]